MYIDPCILPKVFGYFKSISGKTLQNFKTILPEITITGNGIQLKGDRIILPESLQTVAIELTHQGSHPGQSSMERRLRYHFYFHQMKAKVKKVHDHVMMNV